MEKIYALAPNQAAVEQLVEDLHSLGLEDKYIHVVSEQEPLQPNIPEADVHERSDFAQASRRGLLVGGGLGILTGIIVVFYNPELLSPNNITWLLAVIAAGFLFGSAFGIWASTLVGISVPSEKRRQYASELKDGKLLVIINTPEPIQKRVESLISKSSCQIQGSESHFVPV